MPKSHILQTEKMLNLQTEIERLIFSYDELIEQKNKDNVLLNLKFMQLNITILNITLREIISELNQKT
jgi:hypothetical protein